MANCRISAVSRSAAIGSKGRNVNNLLLDFKEACGFQDGLWVVTVHVSPRRMSIHLTVSRLKEKHILKIRCSTESDRVAISRIHTSAFGQEQGQEIVELVNGLLNDETAKPLLSLVAEADGRLVGHILFTSASLQPEHQQVSVRILAPLAVSSDFQGQGVGGVLIREGVKQLAESGVDLVFVLGHPGYYPKFGFQTASVLGFEAPYPIPSEHADAWMVQELKAGVIGSIEGRIQCSSVLNQPQHWRE